MMKKITLGTFALLLSGCVMSPSDTSERDTETYPVRYDRQHIIQEGGNDYGRELQKKELSTNEMESYSDPTSTEKAEEISERLMENRDILLAEVHELEDKIYVAVRLRENNHDRTHQEDILPYIEESVNQIMGDDEKQLIVWTDHIEWNEFKNDDATPDIIKNFDDFFRR